MPRLLSLYLPTWPVDLTLHRLRRLHARDMGAGLPFVLLITTAGNRRFVAHCCPRAAAAGVRPGMVLAHARALLPVSVATERQGPGSKYTAPKIRGGNRVPLAGGGANSGGGAADQCPTLRGTGRPPKAAAGQWHPEARNPRLLIVPFDPRRDRQALLALAHWALRFSPCVAPDPPDGLLLDITGCQRLFRGERRLLDQLLERLHRLGFQGRAAIAPTIGAAWALARFAPGIVVQASSLQASSDAARMAALRGRIISRDQLRPALDALPVEALRLDPATVAALGEVGLTHINHLLALPRATLPSRFTPQLTLRLDQALGAAAETIDPIRPVAPVVVERAFAGPTTQIEAIAITIRELLSELTGRLLHREEGLRRLDLQLDRSDSEPLHLSLFLTRPTRDALHLWKLLRPRVEPLNMGFGIERIVLTAAHATRLRHQQLENPLSRGTGTGLGEGAQPGRLMDELVSRLGPDHVLHVQAVATHIPERTFCTRSVTDPARRGTTTAAIAPADRPSILLPEPEPIQVLAGVDGRPSRLLWRGEERTVIACTGPERIAMEWWREGNREQGTGNSLRAGSPAQCVARGVSPEDRKPHNLHSSSSCSLFPVPCSLTKARDYFALQDDRGRWLWVYREQDSNRWFLHGQWA